MLFQSCCVVKRGTDVGGKARQSVLNTRYSFRVLTQRLHVIELEHGRSVHLRMRDPFELGAWIETQ